MSKISFAVLTISDTCHRDNAKDRSGPRLVQLLGEAFTNARIISEVLPDERVLIAERLKALSSSKEAVSAIITSGGTGFAPRDVTPEATREVLDKECAQLSMALALASLQKTKFAALTRGICGIRRNTLIVNLPGSEKAVVECFEVLRDLLPHALQLLNNDLVLVKRTHEELQGGADATRHMCPHKTGTNDKDDRNSPFPMLPVSQALDIIFQSVHPQHSLIRALTEGFVAPVNIPPFRASIKDGYAMKSSGFSGVKRVVGYISAGDPVNTNDLQEDECFKINTGAPVPLCADCVVQVEDTKLLKTKNGLEDLVEILVEPQANLDIRPVGCDLSKGSKLFPCFDSSGVVIKSLMASVGEIWAISKPKIAVVSTGNELLCPGQPIVEGRIYDSNSIMLEELLLYFGFECVFLKVLNDDFEMLQETITSLFANVDFVICSGGVSMGDKDLIKSVLEKIGFELHFGRVNMKPGKPMTFASKGEKYFFGLPGNPVSAFVTFHLFALPAIRWASGWSREKCVLPTITVILENSDIALDTRPEYMRATITSKNGRLYATVTGNQMSSRLQSIVGADVLLHLPARTETKSFAKAGDIFTASVLRYDFITKYE